MRRFTRRLALAALTIMAASAPLGSPLAAEATSGNRVALAGHDPVAYFTDGRPMMGSAEFSADFDEATYWFTNAEHQSMFVADPDRYAPQYAGHCAINIARGEKTEADPQAWLISDGKLYVFQGPQGVDMFRQQGASIVGEADAAWPGLRVSR